MECEAIMGKTHQVIEQHVTQLHNDTRLKIATQLANIGYWELDPESMLFTFSEQLLQILGTTSDELGGFTMPAQRYADEFMLPEDRLMIETETRLALESTDPSYSRYIEHRIIDTKGHTKHLAVRFTLHTSEDGETVYPIGANQDITDRKLAEQHVQELLLKTTEQNRRLRDFSFMTSHNMRSSVSNLVGLTELLAEEPENSQFMTMLQATVKELDSTVKNISEIINIESGREDSEKRQCYISDSVNRYLELNKALIEKKNIQVFAKFDNDLCINYFPAYLDSIIYNLMSNAIKYGTDESSKFIEIGQITREPVAIYVKDFGQGLDLKVHGERLFSLGSRFHEYEDGQGLGLYMTKHQIEAEGGRIVAESTVGKGTTFKVYF